MNASIETPRSAGIYVRISKDRTGAGLGVERQERDCRALADRLGWTVVEVYSDNDISAYSGKRRPDYERMLADLSAGRINAVIAWHTDRLHRSPLELERYVGVSEERRVPTHTVQAGPLDLSTPSGRMVARQLGAVARYESEHRSERVKAAKAQKAALGAYHGGSRPFGYEKDGKTVVVEEAAEIAKAASAIAGGQSLRSVVRDMNQRQVPTATGKVGTWTSQQVRETLLRPRIAGLSSHHGQVAGKAVWPAVIDESLWRAVCSILRNPARQTNGANAGAVVWLGSGVYKCGICDQRKMRVSQGKGGGGTIPMYRCDNRQAVGGRHVTRNATALDAYVGTAIVKRLSDPQYVDALLRRDESVDAAALRAEELSLIERKNELAAHAGAGEIEPGQLVTATKVINTRLTEITDQLAAAGHRSPLEPVRGGKIEEKWFGENGWTLAQKRAILTEIADVTIKPTRKRGPVGQVDPDGVDIIFRDP
ncbi:recombinase family protein [Mycobacterium seoulense]|uniref:recombinase family protein n=1 Tax=Mycobacterium seoulense TaxID=386911 RepID=UPI003CF0D83E